jgi:uncharacterized protein YndB with AHSA1/START domain
MSIGVFAKVGKRKAAEPRSGAQAVDAEGVGEAMNKSTDKGADGAGGAAAESAWPALRFDQYIAHPPAAVWRALTDPELVGRWWALGDVKPVVGHRFTLDMGQWGVQPCEVTAVDPERRLEYHFARGVLDTTIAWRLEPEGEGTRLFLPHAGFDLDSPLGRQAFAGMGNGWPHVLNNVQRVLDAESAPAEGY